MDELVTAEWAACVLDCRAKALEMEADLKNGNRLGLSHAKKLARIFAGRRVPTGGGIGTFVPAIQVDLALERGEEALTGIGRFVEKLLSGEEFTTIGQSEEDSPAERAARIEVVFSSRVPTEIDLVSKRIVPAKASVIPEIQRQTRSDGAEWRVVVSLPWWIIASDYEREACLHHAFSYLGRNGKTEKPCLRKPDIVGFASNFSRYGINDIRHAQAIAAAAAHPQTHDRLARWHFDLHGQGILWQPRIEIEGGRSQEAEMPGSAAAKLARQTGKRAVRGSAQAVADTMSQ